MKVLIPFSLCAVHLIAVGCLESETSIPLTPMTEAAAGVSLLSETGGPAIDAPWIESVPAVEDDTREAPTSSSAQAPTSPPAPPTHFSTEAEILEHCPVGDGFAYPVGAPDAKGYRDVQPFGRNHHLGEDWNGGQGKGGNGDLGDPIYTIADGIVTYAEPVGKKCRYGWGNVVKIVHNAGTAENPEYVESLYAHLDEIQVKEHQIVKRGEQIGTMGNCNGAYWSHLHFELRREPFLSIGRGYGVDTRRHHDPKKFIERHRYDRDDPTGKSLFAGRPTPPPKKKAI